MSMRENIGSSMLISIKSFIILGIIIKSCSIGLMLVFGETENDVSRLSFLKERIGGLEAVIFGIMAFSIFSFLVIAIVVTIISCKDEIGNIYNSFCAFFNSGFKLSAARKAFYE